MAADTRSELAAQLYTDATEAVAETIARTADRVDRDASFPADSMKSLKDRRLLGAMIPVEHGGRGATLSEVGRVVEIISGACASTAMIYAMHQIQVACLVRHGATPELTDFTRRVANEQLLLASATTEAGVGGDVRTSLCAVERQGERFAIVKEASVISYGLDCDAILVTARRDAEAAASDQLIMIVERRPDSLEHRGTWDTMGFRATCSLGFLLRGEGPLGNIVPEPYADVSAQTMLPTSHTLWSHVWLGIANSSVGKAREYVREKARKEPGVTPPGALRLAETVDIWHEFRSLVHGTTRDYEERMNRRDEISGLGFAVRMNNLKLSSSRLVVDIVGRALQVCGIEGYREDSRYSLSRELRDAYGAPLMVNNDRIYANTARLLLVAKDL